MRRAYVLGDNLLPTPATKPAAEEALNFLDLPNFVGVLFQAEAPLGRQAPLLLHRAQLLSF